MAGLHWLFPSEIGGFFELEDVTQPCLMKALDLSLAGRILVHHLSKPNLLNVALHRIGECQKSLPSIVAAVDALEPQQVQTRKKIALHNSASPDDALNRSATTKEILAPLISNKVTKEQPESGDTSHPRSTGSRKCSKASSLTKVTQCGCVAIPSSH